MVARSMNECIVYINRVICFYQIFDYQPSALLPSFFEAKYYCWTSWHKYGFELYFQPSVLGGWKTITSDGNSLR